MASDERSNGNKAVPEKQDRRKFLGTAAVVGFAGAGLSVGLASCEKSDKPAEKAASSASVVPAAHAKPRSRRRMR